MIISTDAKKAFNKIQHSFMIKTLPEMGIEETYLNIIKGFTDLTCVEGCLLSLVNDT